MEGFSASFRDAVLAPELVLLRAVLRMGVGDHVSASAASKDYDAPHLMMGQFPLVG